MAIFQPSNVVPDRRSGIGLGVIDATQDMAVSWRINGQSALTSFSITIYTNDGASTQKYTTGQITDGCPAYGTTSTGEPQFFSYTIPAADLASAGIANGNEYKLIIQQWWSANDGVTQSSASVFVTRDTPEIEIEEIIGATISGVKINIAANSSGTSTVVLTRAGRNLSKYIRSRTSNGITFSYNATTGGVTVTGTATSNAYSDGTPSVSVASNYTLLKPGTYYAALYDEDGNVIPLTPYVARIYLQTVALDGTATMRLNSVREGTFTVTEDCYAYFRLQVLSSWGAVSGTVYPVLFRESETDRSFEPYKGEDYSISLGRTVTDAATVDVIEGTLTVNGVTYLTPSAYDVTTLAGVNNLWSDAESVEVTMDRDGDEQTYSGALVTVNSGIGDINTRYYTFTGNYSQAQGDVLNWFRWQIAYADDTDNPFYDSENISGTMDISCYYDGFFTGTQYAVRLTAQTENGVEVDTGWVTFSPTYTITATTGAITAGCADGTDAVLAEWSGIGYFPGEASGSYSISDDEILTLPSGSTVTWDETTSGAMGFAEPWSVVWKGAFGSTSADLFTIGQSGGNVRLNYDASSNSVILYSGATTLATKASVKKGSALTAVLTPTALNLRFDYKGGGLYPTTTLYPSDTLYPQDDTQALSEINTYTLSYTQTAITSVALAGYQTSEFMEVISGAASGTTITQAITDGSYTAGLNDTDYMLLDWSDGLNAGTLDIGGDTLAGFALYRRQGSEGRLVKVGETATTVSTIYDYGALSQQGPYTYYLFPIGTTKYIATPLVTGSVSPCWWNWTLMECAATDDDNIFTVLSAFRFRYSIQTGDMANNNAPSVLQNFTPYPKVQLAPQNYRSSTLTGLIGAVRYEDGQPRYLDTIETRDAIYALSVSQNALFLKDRKGDLFRVKIAGAITMQTGDNTKQQTQTMSLPWVEVGSAENVSLYSTETAAVTQDGGADN